MDAYLEMQKLNEGVGTMDAYLEMQKLKTEMKDQQTRASAIKNCEAHDSSAAPPIVSVFETGESSHAKIIRRRGPTKMNHVFTRKLNERPLIRLNHDPQPYAKDKTVVCELSIFLGTIARLYIPPDFVNWSKVPEEKKIEWWEYVKTKYIICEEGKDWVLKTPDDSWRVYKSHFKSKCFTKYNNDEDRIRSKPANIPLKEFMVLVKYWNNEGVQDKSAKNIANRKLVTDTHSAGHTSFAELHSKMKIAKLDGENATKARFYLKSRKGHIKRAKKNGEDPEESDDEDEEMVKPQLCSAWTKLACWQKWQNKKIKEKFSKK